jgi:TRAP-type C4-dicarboxylate transport system permease small subunit
MKPRLKQVLEMFDDWLTRAVGIVFILIVGIVVFNMRSSLAETRPFLAAVIYGMVPVLFIVGGVIYVLAILKLSRQDNSNGTS